MNIEALKNKQWTDLLLSLPIGTTVLQFNSLEDIDSCKSIAYRMNKNPKYPLTYSVSVNELYASFTATERK